MDQVVHRIRTFRWAAHARSSTQAFRIRKCLNDLWPNMLKNVFETAFDEISNDHRIIRIPKIELRIAIKSEKELSEALPRLAAKQLEEHLQIIRTSEIQYPRNINWKISSRKQNRLQSLLHYLKTGSLYWFDPGDSSELELRESFREHYQEVMSHLLSANETAVFYFRLLEILASDQQISMVNDLSKRIPAKSMQLIILVLTKGREYFSRHTQLKLASVLIQITMESKCDPTAMKVDLLEKSERRALKHFVSTFPKKIKRSHRLSPTASDTISKVLISPTKVFKDHPVKIESPVNQEEEEKYPFAVSNAGLILLHPFIISLFENTGIIKSGRDHQFTPIILTHAAALLYFLATGREDVHEWELGCIKILLGLEPESPLLISEGLISAVDKDESEALLQSAINHWSALKNTSVHGFQSSFLQRQGLIRDEEECWKLQVESKSFDVLLDHLPWNINIVKLPWMKKAIYTEWEAR